MRRFRTPVAKENELLVKYGKEYGDEDLFYCYPESFAGLAVHSGVAFKAADNLTEANHALGMGLVSEPMPSSQKTLRRA